MCRICLSDEDLEIEHELISPCLCSGSLKYIGSSCLREWLDGKKQFREGPIVNSYIWKGLECEICKGPFPDSVVSNKSGKEINLLNYKIHESCENYAILESISNSTNLTIHICNFDEVSTIQVGRG